ncbi:MAG: peptidoglycan DD-metalloendopeptidase family protein, partial [Actinobacteria bacterium]|nr:peptidoglycan DD-metalloendopeptidase family protein [Actinomycetota bacterium]
MHRLLVIGVTALVALASSGSAIAWSWPADGQVVRPFQMGADAYAGGQHRGIDVGGPEGSPVGAPASGTVTFAGSVPTHGRGVTISTADGYSVTLFHLGSISVGKGDTVAEGVPVGVMGSSGDPEHATPTVHLGIRRTSDEHGYVDPLGLLPARAAQPSPVPSPPTAAPAPVPA